MDTDQEGNPVVMPTGDETVDERMRAAMDANRWVTVSSGSQIEYAEEWHNLILAAINGMNSLKLVMSAGVSNEKTGAVTTRVSEEGANHVEVSDTMLISGSVDNICRRLDAVVQHLEDFTMIADDRQLGPEQLEIISKVADDLRKTVLNPGAVKTVIIDGKAALTDMMKELGFEFDVETFDEIPGLENIFFAEEVLFEGVPNDETGD